MGWGGREGGKWREEEMGMRRLAEGGGTVLRVGGIGTVGEGVKVGWGVKVDVCRWVKRGRGSGRFLVH